jgi:dGTPase
VTRETSTGQAQREDRLHSPDRTGDQRDAFQRDRDRLLYSSAFRRLAGVTQVVHAAEGSIFHNRLTHTLKVAQIGRRLAEYLVESQPQDVEAIGGIEPEVVEVAALAHDLGHPPFGHIAEAELDKQLRDRSIADGYEGNAQSFRIITKVAIRQSDHKGLNLTRASLNAVLKYPWGRDGINQESKKFKKWGYYHSEEQEFKFARALHMSGDERQSAEATLMDWADDITYSVHDVEDFYRAGLVPLDQLLSKTDEREHFIETVLGRWKDDSDPSKRDFLPSDASKLFDDLNVLIGSTLGSPFVGSGKQQSALNYLSSTLIRRYILGEESPERKAIKINNTVDTPFIEIDRRLRLEVDFLKELMRHYVFCNPALVAQQYGQRKIIRELFGILFEASTPSSNDKNIIPYPFNESLEENGQSETERARIVTDLIASMTEQQAILFYQRLIGISSGSVRDLIIQ